MTYAERTFVDTVPWEPGDRTVVEVLRIARALVGEERRWVRNHPFRSGPNGSLEARGADRFSVYGAFWAQEQLVTSTPWLVCEARKKVVTEAMNLFCEIVGAQPRHTEFPVNSLVQWHDMTPNLTHKDVLRFFDEAIVLAHRRAGGSC